ncbi:unnamed protein product [Pylaiella littoralis]
MVGDPCWIGTWCRISSSRLGCSVWPRCVNIVLWFYSWRAIAAWIEQSLSFCDVFASPQLPFLPSLPAPLRPRESDVSSCDTPTSRDRRLAFIFAEHSCNEWVPQVFTWTSA